MDQALVLPGSVSETALDLPADLTFEKWQQTGEALGRVARACQWWIGDWLNYGKRAYGEKYAQAMDATGYDYSTVSDWAWVSKAVEPSVRTEGLSWSHHKQIAALNPPDQDRWLTAAEANGWSKAQLRKQIKGTVSTEAECCPTCGRKLPAATKED